jgi:Protein of unknown function (DUF3572)
MAKAGKKSAHFNRESAEALALQGLAFLAEDAGRMLAFLKLTGLEPGELRDRAGSPELSLAVLEHLSRDESLLLVFATSRGVRPEAISRALALLEGPQS